jgi:DNA-binding transcriptional ArsR family regulator
VRSVWDQTAVSGGVLLAKLANRFKKILSILAVMAEWSFLTNHARALVCIADDPGVRLRDIAAALGITERTAFGIVTDLAEAGYVVKDKDGRRNRYRIQEHLPLPEAVGRERTIGEVLGLLIDTRAPESAQPPDRNAASNRPASTRVKPSPRRDRKSAPPSDVRTRSQHARDSAARQGKQ